MLGNALPKPTAAMTGTYLGYGLAIRSALAIPGAIPIHARVPDIDIGEGPADIPEPERQAGPYRLAGNRLLFEMAGIGRYLCTRNNITIERAPGADDARVAAYLVATALPACLWMRGEMVLHAAAALLPGATRAFAVAGVSGSGKSSVLRELVQMGAKILADDTLCIRADLEGSGLPGGYFLGSQERAFHGLSPESWLERAPLCGLAILQLPRPDAAPEFGRLRGVEAVEALLANRHRPRIPALLGVAGGQIVRVAALARDLPVHVWRRREGVISLDPAELDVLAGGSVQ
jgi:hypothetical protein